MTNPKLLLIEDDDTMLSLLVTLLRLEGFDVTQIDNDEDPNDVLTSIQAETPDLILLDVHLSQYNGFDMLRLIRDDENIGGTRVLMSSGMDFSERCAKEGADGFILKPYMPEDLIKTIRQTLADENASA